MTGNFLRDITVLLKIYKIRRSLVLALLAGHWGLQWYLQQHDFVAVEDDHPIEEDWLVLSSSAWPQQGSKGIYQLQRIWTHQNIYIGPTVYSISDHSHFHANMIAPDIHTYAAWGLQSQDF